MDSISLNFKLKKRQNAWLQMGLNGNYKLINQSFENNYN